MLANEHSMIQKTKATHKNSLDPDSPSPPNSLNDIATEDRAGYKSLHKLISNLKLDNINLEEPTSSGPTVQTVIAVPRFSIGIRSATNPPPTVTGTELAIPMTNRETINMGILTLAAQTIAATMNRVFAACVKGSLP